MQTTDVFPLVPRRRLVGLSFGGMHSARRGSGSDVAGSRPYQPGDDVRAIDWAASARQSSARAADEFIVREHYADEAPRVVVLCDYRPSMAFFPPELPWLSKPLAMRNAAELVVESAIAARGFLGYLDMAESSPAWRPPRTQRVPPQLAAERPFTAPPDALARAFEHLRQHRQALPSGSFVFVLSDFLEGADEVWFETLEHRWDVVPVVIQDPVWEQSFPDVAGVVLRLVDPREGRVRPVRLTAGEVAERRATNERSREELLERLRGLEVEPVLVSSHNRTAILDAFLEWADRRVTLRSRAW
jgi:uncharacterized protein (DUF58 family)